MLIDVQNTENILLQNFLGAEGTSLQWRLIASHLITRLSRDSLSDKSEVGSMPDTSGIHILSDLFVVLGYFALNNPDNQVRFVSVWRSNILLNLKRDLSNETQLVNNIQ